MRSTTIVVPWRDRPEIERMLAANLREVGDVDVVIVCHGGDSMMLADIVHRLGDPRVRVLELAAESFNKSVALNAGIDAARTQYILTLDADVILQDFDLAQAAMLADSGHWVTLGRVTESAADGIQPGRIAELAYIIEVVLTDGRRVQVETSRRFFDVDARSCPGIVFGRREDLLAIDGYHSGLVGWGWEDIDVQVRLGLLGRTRVELGRGLHLTHGNEVRHVVGGSPAEDNRRNQARCMARYDAGDFSGTLGRDVGALRESC